MKPPREDAPLPEADALAGTPHPRHAPRVIGQDGPAQELIAAMNADRLHHAWLMSGPRGIGKATLAWAFATRLLSDAPVDHTHPLHVPQGDPTARRIAALSEARLALVRRSWDDKTKRLRAEIGVDDIRRLHRFFQLSAAEGGRRVAIIDAADEMTPQAANALLKLLEEPPKRAVLLLIAHRPGRLLPTIRSRCRMLSMSPLSPEAMAEILAQSGHAGEEAAALAALAAGSAGDALVLLAQNGPELYARIVKLFATLPRMDRSAALRLAEAAGARPTPDGDPFDLFVTLLDRFLARTTRAGLFGAPLDEACPGEAATMARISPDPAAAQRWAAAQAEISARARRARALNLDPQALVVDMLTGLARIGADPTSPR